MTSHAHLELVTVAQEPDLFDQIDALTQKAWPLYVSEAPPADREEEWADWYGLPKRWPHLQFGLRAKDGTLVACGNALSMPWDEATTLPNEGWRWEMARGVSCLGQRPTAMFAVSASVHPEHQGQGLSRVLLQSMRTLAKNHHLAHLFAPVRPCQKERYPLLSIQDYVSWTREDGLHVDPWIRAHQRVGGTIIAPCAESMTFGATKAKWHTWSGVTLGPSGQYLVPGQLAPLNYDAEQDWGVYIEPNVWMHHQIQIRDDMVNKR